MTSLARILRIPVWLFVLWLVCTLITMLAGYQCDHGGWAWQLSAYLPFRLSLVSLAVWSLFRPTLKE